MLRDGGRYVVVGQYTDSGDATVNPHRQINRRHATILGCWGYEFSHLYRSLALMARHNARFRWRELVTREYPLDRAGEALADMENALCRESPHPARNEHLISERGPFFALVRASSAPQNVKALIRPRL